MSDLRRVMRVLREDDDFIVAEIPKRDDVKMTVAPPPGETQKTPQFFIFMYVRSVDGKQVPWDPFDPKEQR